LKILISRDLAGNDSFASSTTASTKKLFGTSLIPICNSKKCFPGGSSIIVISSIFAHFNAIFSDAGVPLKR